MTGFGRHAGGPRFVGLPESRDSVRRGNHSVRVWNDATGAVHTDFQCAGPIRVQTVVDEFQEVGVWNAGWDGVDHKGSRVAAGVYYVKLITGGQRYHRPVIVLR